MSAHIQGTGDGVMSAPSCHTLALFSSDCSLAIFISFCIIYRHMRALGIIGQRSCVGANVRNNEENSIFDNKLLAKPNQQHTADVKNSYKTCLTTTTPK